MSQTATEPPSDLLAMLVQANYNAYAANSQALIDSLMGQVADLQAKLDAIRDGVGAALDGPYMPVPARLLSLLWPSDETVARYRQERQS